MVDHPEPRRADDAGDVVVIDRGESAQAMRQKLAEASAGPPHDLVIDLRSVDDLSNPGLGVLVEVRGRQRARHLSLTLLVDAGAEHALTRAGMQGTFTTAPAAPSR